MLKSFQRFATPNPMLSMMAARTSGVCGHIPIACFAKYSRDKPHINVGTIGKFILKFYVINFFV